MSSSPSGLMRFSSGVAVTASAEEPHGGAVGIRGVVGLVVDGEDGPAWNVSQNSVFFCPSAPRSPPPLVRMLSTRTAALRRAASRGDVNEVRSLIEGGSELEATDEVRPVGVHACTPM